MSLSETMFENSGSRNLSLGTASQCRVHFDVSGVLELVYSKCLDL